MDLFFYGTLMDVDVLSAVTGRGGWARRLEPASVAGFRRVYRAGSLYPVLLSASEQTVDGVVVRRVDAAAVRRIVRFEGAEYRLSETAASLHGGETVMVRLFLPRPGVPVTGEAFDLEDWRQRHKARYLPRINRWSAARAML